MNNKLRIVLYGIAIWALPFVVGMLLFTIQSSHADIFDTLMKLFLLLGVMVFTALYLVHSGESSVRHLVLVGMVWTAVCLMIDIPLFVLVFGWPMEQYLMDVPLGYLIIPLAAGGMAKAYLLGAGRIR